MTGGSNDGGAMSRRMESSRSGWIRKRWSSELRATEVVVLHGGRGGEREISLASGKAVIEALEEGGEVGRVLPVEIAADGRWSVDGVLLSAPIAVQALPPRALYFLALHGGAGEDGRMQAFLELSGRRYTGSGPLASGTAMDKRRAREAAGGAGLRTAPARLVAREFFEEDPERELAAIAALGKAPWFIKPNRGGSSVGVSRAADPAQLRSGLVAAFEVGHDALVECAQEGLEVTAGVIGNRGEAPLLLPVVEILPVEGEFFDYQEKYAEGGARELCPPEHLSPQAAARVQARALAIYRAVGCEGYARIDFIAPDDQEPVFLEVNTLPGLSPRSILPQAAAVAGADFPALVAEICARALARFAQDDLQA